MYSNVETKRLETLMEKGLEGKKNVVMTFEISETCKNVARTHVHTNYTRWYNFISQMRFPNVNIWAYDYKLLMWNDFHNFW